MSTKKMMWKVQLPALFNEALSNDGAQILEIPFKVTLAILNAVATRAAELDDPKMLLLMCRLGLYEIADPSHKDYDCDIFDKLEKLIAEGNNDR